jgi:hypothetical protein
MDGVRQGLTFIYCTIRRGGGDIAHVMIGPSEVPLPANPRCDERQKESRRTYDGPNSVEGGLSTWLTWQTRAPLLSRYHIHSLAASLRPSHCSTRRVQRINHGYHLSYF